MCMSAITKRNMKHWKERMTESSPVVVALRNCVSRTLSSSLTFKLIFTSKRVAHIPLWSHLRHAVTIMGLLRNVLIFVTVVSFFTFVAFFGQLPALRKTPIGWIHRLIWVDIPRAFRRIDQLLFAGRFAERGQRLGRYLFHEKNPVVMVSQALLFLTLHCQN